MDILKRLALKEEWDRFLEYKQEKGHLTRADEEELRLFIENREYLPIAEKLSEGGFFSMPEAVRINKRFSDKKRTVFIFPREENYIQKMLAFLLLDYDGLFCENLYSFRKNTGVKKAVNTLTADKSIKDKYSYKLDISDYFGSVKPELILPVLKEALSDQPRLFSVLKEMLENPYALCDEEAEKIKKGILAGSPVSGFMANLFITELDRYFYQNGIPYARYSDDIIFFSDTKEELNKLIKYTDDFLSAHSLSQNEKKICITAPGEKWSFLGFSFENGTIDISDVAKMKLKGKLKRKANALVRWKRRKNAEPERAVRAFIKYFNKKLFMNPVRNELTWARWYFPIINTDSSLREIDSYMQQCIRYIATEKRTKKQYDFKYTDMKKLGYVTLVNKYYEGRRT